MTAAVWFQALCYGAIPAAAMAVGSLAVCCTQPPPKLQAICQRFASGLLMGIAILDVFPLLHARIQPGGKVDGPNTIAMYVGFILAVIIMYSLDTCCGEPEFVAEEEEEDEEASKSSSNSNANINKTKLEAVSEGESSCETSSSTVDLELGPSLSCNNTADCSKNNSNSSNGNKNSSSNGAFVREAQPLSLLRAASLPSRRPSLASSPSRRSVEHASSSRTVRTGGTRLRRWRSTALFLGEQDAIKAQTRSALFDRSLTGSSKASKASLQATSNAASSASKLAPRMVIPWGVIVAVLVDSCVDGMLIGLTTPAGSGGLTLSIATALEMCFLGFSFTLVLMKTMRRKWASLIALAPCVGLIVASVAAALCSKELQNTTAFAGLLAFCLIALLFMIVEELLVEARENDFGDLWSVGIWFYMGLLLSISMEIFI